jgi:hypothetical protein
MTQRIPFNAPSRHERPTTREMLEASVTAERAYRGAPDWRRSKFGSESMVAHRAASPKAKGSKPVTLAKINFGGEE